MADIQAIKQKQAAGIPLTPQEQMSLSYSAISGPILDLGKYGVNPAAQPEEQQYTPEEIDQLMGLSANEEEQAALSKQMQMADSLRGAQMPEMGRIQQSNGTSYTPAAPESSMWSTIAQRAVGQMKANRVEREQKALREEAAKARKTYAAKVANPQTAGGRQMTDMIDAANEAARAKAAMAPAAPLTTADKLRNFRQKYMTI